MSYKSQYLEITNYKMFIQEITKSCVGHGLQSVSMRLQEETRERVTKSAVQITSGREKDVHTQGTA